MRKCQWGNIHMLLTRNCYEKQINTKLLIQQPTKIYNQNSFYVCWHVAVVKQLFSDFAERFDQRSHFCIADLYGFLSILQLWRQPRSDRHARQHVSAAVVVPHTAMNLTTDETGQHPLLQTNQPNNQPGNFRSDRGSTSMSHKNVWGTLWKSEFPLITATG